QSLHRKGPSRLFLFEHVQHAIGHHEATDDVDGGQDDRNDTQYRGQPAGVLAATGTDDGADHDNPGDGVGAAHQRGVQGGGYLVDDFDADEDRQYEDRKGQHEDFHYWASFSIAARRPSCLISPFSVTRVLATISSSMFRAR